MCPLESRPRRSGRNLGRCPGSCQGSWIARSVLYSKENRGEETDPGPVWGLVSLETSRTLRGAEPDLSVPYSSLAGLPKPHLLSPPAPVSTLTACGEAGVETPFQISG